MNKRTATLEVQNRLGLHARVAARLVQTAERFKAAIFLEYDGQEVNSKSLLGILTLACPKGSLIVVRAEGTDADDAMRAFETLFAERFGED